MREFTPETLTAALAQHDDAPGAPVLFAGTPQIAADALAGLLSAGTQVAAVLTRPDAPVGRKKTLTPSPVAQTAQTHGIPVIKTSRIDQETRDQIAGTGAQLGVVVAYGTLLPQRALDALPLGWVNLHYSRLPAYRGAAPVQHAILHGETTTAATVFQLEAGMDTGPVHGVVEYPIPEGASAGQVLDELTQMGTDLLAVLLPELLAGSSDPQPQQGQPSFAPKLIREDAYIDPARPAQELVRRINATIPEPGAWALLGAGRIKLGPARRYEAALPGELLTGTVTLLPHDREPQGKLPVLTVGAGAVVLSQVQPAGKTMMDAASWLNGQQGDPVLGARG